MKYYLIENSFRINGKNNQTYKVFSVSLPTQLAAKPKFTPSNKKATLHTTEITLYKYKMILFKPLPNFILMVVRNQTSFCFLSIHQAVSKYLN